MHKKITLFCLMALSVFGLMACGRNQTASSTQGSQEPRKISQSDAKLVALAAAGVKEKDVSDLKIEEGTQNGKAVYIVTFLNRGKEEWYAVDAQPGQAQEASLDVQSEEEQPLLALTAEDASGIVFADFGSVYGVGEADVQELTIEVVTEGEVAVYRVQFSFDGSAYRYDIDGNTGEILAFEQTPL